MNYYQTMRSPQIDLGQPEMVVEVSVPEQDVDVTRSSDPERLDDPSMHFYASSAYLDVAARTYFEGRHCDVAYVRIEDEVFRLLVVDHKHVVTDLEFVDYHQPVSVLPAGATIRRAGFLKSAVLGKLAASEWDSTENFGLEPAPFVDWSRFDSYQDYETHLKTRRKGLLSEQKRRRRRLAESFGELEFCMHDERGDVFELAMRWKRQQLLATGARDYLADQRNVRHFELLMERGLLTASTLRADGRLLSVWLGFVHDRVWSGWIFAYDPDPALRKYSVGKQLLHSMLEESFRRGHREFDFSIGDEDYKWFFATDTRVLGPVGQPPLSEQVRKGAREAKRYGRQALERHPRLFDGAVAIGGALKRRRSWYVERVSRGRGI